MPTQLSSVIFRAEGATGGLAMRQWLTAPDPNLARTLHVADREGGEVDPDALLAVVDASSAFPVA